MVLKYFGFVFFLSFIFRFSAALPLDFFLPSFFFPSVADLVEFSLPGVAIVIPFRASVASAVEVSTEEITLRGPSPGKEFRCWLFLKIPARSTPGCRLTNRKDDSVKYFTG